LTDDTFTMAPVPRARIDGSTARMRRSAPRRFVSNRAATSASAVSSMGA
jgi:hypothetical protein